MKNSIAQKRRFLLLVLGVCAFSHLASIAQTNMAGEAHMLDITRDHSRISTDLANTLVSIATEYRVPIVAELTATEDPKVDVTPGKATARQLLNSLVARSPEYAWKEQAGVVHFYNKTILNALAHPLNFKLKSFQLPDNISQLKIFLPGAPLQRIAGFAGRQCCHQRVSIQRIGTAKASRQTIPQCHRPRHSAGGCLLSAPIRFDHRTS